MTLLKGAKASGKPVMHAVHAAAGLPAPKPGAAVSIDVPMSRGDLAAIEKIAREHGVSSSDLVAVALGVYVADAKSEPESSILDAFTPQRVFPGNQDAQARVAKLMAGCSLDMGEVIRQGVARLCDEYEHNGVVMIRPLGKSQPPALTISPEAAKLIRDAAAVLGIDPQEMADTWLNDQAAGFAPEDANGELADWLAGRVRGFRFASRPSSLPPSSATLTVSARQGWLKSRFPAASPPPER